MGGLYISIINSFVITHHQSSIGGVPCRFFINENIQSIVRDLPVSGYHDVIYPNMGLDDSAWVVFSLSVLSSFLDVVDILNLRRCCKKMKIVIDHCSYHDLCISLTPNGKLHDIIFILRKARNVRISGDLTCCLQTNIFLLSSFRHLQSLELHSSLNSYSVQSLTTPQDLAESSEPSALSRLVLKGSYCDPFSVIQSINLLSNLKELTLYQFTFLTDGSLEALSLPNLQVLKIQNSCLIISPKISNVSQSLAQLSIVQCVRFNGLRLGSVNTKFCVDSCDFSYTSIKTRKLLKILDRNPQFQRLYVVSCRNIVHLQIAHSCLKVLDVSSCVFLETVKIFCDALCEMRLRHCKSLQSLILRSSFLKSLELKMLENLEVLELECPLLRDLDILCCTKLSSSEYDMSDLQYQSHNLVAAKISSREVTLQRNLINRYGNGNPLVMMQRTHSV